MPNMYIVILLLRCTVQDILQDKMATIFGKQKKRAIIILHKMRKGLQFLIKCLSLLYNELFVELLKYNLESLNK